MTIDQIKKDLPDVRLVFQGKEYVGHLSGRKEPQATVWLEDIPEVEFSFSWQAVANVLNRGAMLRP
jgi:hypothetical protein